MAVVMRSWSQRQALYAVAAKYALRFGIDVIKDAVTHGPRRLLRTRDRTATPAVLNDPALGTHGYVELQDVRLHYVANGPEDAPLMLFLHGFPEFWFSWRHQLKHFAKKYRCVAIDMRGYNDSDKPAAMTDYHITKLISDVRQTIEALGYTRCILVGHDWGAVIAWAFANFYPELLDRMVIINGSHHFAFIKHISSSKTQYDKSWYAFFFQMPSLPEFLMRKNDYEFIEKSLNEKKYSGNETKKAIFSREEVEVYKHAMAKPGAIESTINYYRASFQCNGPRYPTRDIRVSTLIIWGTADQALDTELAELSGSYVNNCKIHYIHGASHFVPVEHPDEVNTCIDKFLAEQLIPKGLSKL